MDFQFYPTPEKLARRAWRKFKNRDFVRVLEPSAGNGDLALAHQVEERFGRHMSIDCCEIDIAKHAVLRSKHLNVVGNDFLKLSSGSIYSHIVLNPPFAEGAKHVLKAWDILWDGEIVAIINAETVRNPFSKERQLLVRIIEQHGEVEFIDGAFSVPEAERKTEVDVALVYLRKQADATADIVGDLFAELQRDSATNEGLAAGYQTPQSLTLPNSFIENSVLAFNAGMRSMRDSVFAEAKAQYYADLIGETMAVRNGDGGSTRTDTSVEWVRKEIGNRYLDLKDRAWASILRSSNVTSRLSSSAQRRVESEFEQIKKLEFTVENIYGFLCGIIESQGTIQIQMVCDIFDLITKYHTDNTVFYKGWKSNDKHRTCGISIKTTRFILPRHSGYSHGLQYESKRLLSDFDKVFAMLDGKAAPETSLEWVFDKHYNALRHGERLSSSYFDVRYYPGAGTIHFFPRDKKLIGRLNRLVGRERRWLPPEGVRVSEAFWLQVDNAEKFDKELRTELDKHARSGYSWDHPLTKMMHYSDDDRNSDGLNAVNKAIDTVLERHGISVDFQLEDGGEQQCLLAA